MFQETKAKRSPMQIIGVIVIFILAILIVLTFVLFGIFKDAGSAPKLFGSRVYVISNDLMEPRIPKGSAVFVKEGVLPEPNNAILCSIDNNLYVIGFLRTEVTESGETSYIVKYDNATDDRTWGISESDIIGVAQSYDSFFGWVIRFTSSKMGMMIIVIIPCALIVVYELLMMLLSRRNRDAADSWAAVPDDGDLRKVRPVPEPGETLIHRLVNGDTEDNLPEREDVQVPVDAAVEERYVEKQLKRASDKLNTTVLETAGSVEPKDIRLDQIDVSADVPSFSKTIPSIKPTQEDKPISIDDLSASRIDELIKMLEEEKKRLEDK